MSQQRSFKLLGAAAVVAGIFGCSDPGSTLSVDDQEQPIISGGLSDLSVRDFSVAQLSTNGTSYKWALSAYPAPTNADYYLYQMGPNSRTWVRTSHYGVLLSATANGRCLHINSKNEIWWATLTSNGKIDNGSTIVKFSDISASSAGALYVYVIGTNSSGQTELWKYVSYPGGSYWKQIQVRIIDGGTPIHIASDASDGRKILLSTGQGAQSSSDAGETWVWVDLVPPHSTAAWYQGNIIIKTTPNGRLATKKARAFDWKWPGIITPYNAVAIGDPTFYWINDQGRIEVDYYY